MKSPKARCPSCGRTAKLTDNKCSTCANNPPKFTIGQMVKTGSGVISSIPHEIKKMYFSGDGWTYRVDGYKRLFYARELSAAGGGNDN